MAQLTKNSLSGKYPLLEFTYPNLRTGYRVLRTVQIVGEDDKYLEGFETTAGNQFKRFLKSKVVGDIKFLKMEPPLVKP